MVAGVRGLLQSFDTQRQAVCSIALGLPLFRLETLTAVLSPSLTARLNACDAMATKTFTLAECEKHTSEKDCWLIIHGAAQWKLQPFVIPHVIRSLLRKPFAIPRGPVFIVPKTMCMGWL